MSDLESRAIIAPSILAADFAHLAKDIKTVSNADWIHVDIMDGHFVPNLSFGPMVTETVHQLTSQELDVHLMIEEPEKWVDSYIDAGAACVIFHVEATHDPVALARHIRSRGVRAGFSLRPGTDLTPYIDVLAEFDLVLVMSVEPGFGGQSFMPEQLEKVRQLRKEITHRNLSTLIEIDGGIGTDTIEQAAAAGCDAFVAGSAVFGSPNPHAVVAHLRELATRAATNS
ncbi:ribulose-phosphate 3-epimerase [Corynebacterium sp. ES2794-CONJ1]|uniref:ribulose-phosphate 3-epimerase n=1 Tax=unclassified Corynebacterium TaxID=2624378 RepID=UPI00216867B2|nr:MULTISPECIES: ribulose-phosphate 3-epimerase [unclassified Corynebacterium]MCS4489277.1 ribulose-phosphate 3-epimerase [Corynebacterium sp. ES2775-CONJ]MCS4491090.1 ribulose-phosphate 3-epimerase [Corynebacterium sp. ES2715-CONJ3]MCS4531029.1 ribulose-phosphate 3-epimerase [Corynebacterium sp. ES2730-CONJ]MCU9518396.1 ribulose-phosphate 3-epimerase [Corynebacterium sp. ES2794-CONJ1]